MTKHPAGAPAAHRRNGLPRKWRETFIHALGETSNVAAAARAAGISPSQAYKVRRNDPEFRRQWFTALCEGYDNLEMDLLCWLRTGKVQDMSEQTRDEQSTDKQKEKDTEQNTNATAPAERKFDAATALRVLTAHRESVARERGRQTMEDEASVIAAINAKIAAMRSRERATARLLKTRRKAGDAAKRKTGGRDGQPQG